MFLLDQSYWEIKDVGKKGRGVFAKRDIQAGTVIGDYIGKMIREEDEDQYDNGEHYYLMYYSDDATITPDADKPGIHLLNHSCEPNVWMYTYKGHTLYFALRHIFAGEELNVSYMLSELDPDCEPCVHLCYCASKLCTGTMHMSKKHYAQWDAFESEIDEQTQRDPFEFGKDLPLLAKYPENIPDAPIYTLFGAAHEKPLVLENKVLPSLEEIRKQIRQSGRSLHFSALNIHVLGVLHNLAITEPISQ